MGQDLCGDLLFAYTICTHGFCVFWYGIKPAGINRLFLTGLLLTYTKRKSEQIRIVG
jgi:hypothetical protein